MGVGSNLLGMSTASTPSLWEIRKAVKPWLSDSSQTILFGCSGGADSMALALALFYKEKLFQLLLITDYNQVQQKLLHKLFLNLKILVIPKLNQQSRRLKLLMD